MATTEVESHFIWAQPDGLKIWLIRKLPAKISLNTVVHVHAYLIVGTDMKTRFFHF